MRYLVVLALALGVTPFANSQPTQGYYGLTLGSLDYEEGDGDGGTLLSDSVSLYRLIAGYEFSDYLAIEGGYTKSGTARGLVDVDTTLHTEMSSLGVRAVGRLPLKNITLYGALGYADTKQKYRVSDSAGTFFSESFSDSSADYAVGVEVGVGDRIGIRAEYEKLDLDGLFESADASDVSVTFLLKF